MSAAPSRPAEAPESAESAESAEPADAAAARPAIRVLAGSPTAEEVAALVAVLSAVGGAPEEHAPHASAWSDPSWRLLGPSRTNGGWRASGLPR